MRVFIAIDIDEKIKKALSSLQKQLAVQADIEKPDVKWVKVDNIHLTLKFLGEVKAEKIADLCNIVAEAAQKHKSFELGIESVGYFGNRSARILWVGTRDGSDNVSELQEDIEQQLSLAGWPKENRKFSGHLTLCRVKSPKAGRRLAKITDDYKDFKLGILPVYSVSVYQSELTGKGPVYTVLGRYKLEKSENGKDKKNTGGI